MNPEWQAFLESHNALVTDQAARFEPGNLGDCNLFDLSHLGLIRVSGEDAENFLQGQLTNDVRNVTLEASQLSSYCSVKGRMLANFRLFRIGDDTYMQMPRSRVAPMVQRLRMFVLRSKVTLDDVSDNMAQMALAGDCALAILGDLAAVDTDGTVQGDGFVCVRLAGDRPRFMIAGTPAALQPLWIKALHRAVPANPEHWRLLDIRAGLPTVYDQTVETFVPQMANMQLVNGVSFTKGCYTGQEVVARMQYLGRLKRRMFLTRCGTDTCPEPGTELFAAGSASGQGAGRIVDAAPSPEGGCEALAVVEISAAMEGDVRIENAEGVQLEFLDLPYALPDTADAAGE